MVNLVARVFVATIFALVVTGCGRMAMTRSGFEQSSEIPPFFSEVAASHFENAYKLLCPPIKDAIDYRQFVSALNAHPFVKMNGGFSTYRSETQLGSGATIYPGWLTTLSGGVPAEMIVHKTQMGSCLLAVSILGSSILPPFRTSTEEPQFIVR